MTILRFFCHACAEITLFVIFKNEIINNNKIRRIKMNLLEFWVIKDFERIPIYQTKIIEN